MSTVGELNVLITADSSGYISQLNNVQTQTNRVMNNVSSVMSRVKRTIATALGTAAIVSFGKSCLELGSDLAEVQNVVDSVFTTMSDSVNSFAKNAAQTYGLSETMAKKYMGTFGAMANAFGFTEQEAYNMSSALTGLAGDVASFYNMTQDEAYTKLKSVFTGETESLKELGVVMTENALNSYAQAQGINSTVSAMSEQEKVALRYNFVLNQLSLAQGDFAKTSDSWANQIRIMQLSFESFKATMGQGLINVFLPVIKVLNVVIQKLQVFAAYFSAITGALFGKAQAGTNSVSNSLAGSSNSLSNSLGKVGNSANNSSKSLKKASNATKKAGTAAKKAKKEIKGLIGGLDEINNLSVKETAGTSGTSGSTPRTSTPSTSGIGGIGDLGIGSLGDIETLDLGANIDTAGIEAKVEKIKKIIDNFKKWLQTNKDAIISIVAGMVAGIASYFVMSKWSAISGAILTFLKPFKTLVKVFKTFGIKGVLNSFMGLLSINPVFLAIAAAIGVVVSSLVYLWRTNKDFKNKVIKTWNNIKQALEPWLKAFAELFKVIADIIKTVVVAAFKLLSKIVSKVVEVLSGDLMDDINKLCPGVQNLGEVFLKFVKTLSKVWKHVKDFCKKVSNMVKKLGLKKTIEILMKKLIEKIVEKVGEIKKKFNDKFKEVTDNIKKYISEKWEELKDGVKDFVLNITSKVEDFKDKVIEKWEDVKTWTKDKVLEIGAKVADFYKAIEEKLEEAKTWLKDKALEIGSKVASFYDKVKDAYNIAKDKIKEWAFTIASKVESLYDKVKDAYNYAKGKIKEWAFSIGAKVGSFYDKVKSAYNTAKSKIKSWAFSIDLKVNTSANNVKDTINGIIKKVNNAVMGKIKFTVPSWIPVFGGKTWKAPTIPYLAKGGIVDSATLAMIGEAGKEAVIPLENNTQGLDLLASKLQTRMSTSGVSGTFSGFNNSSNNTPKEVYNGDVVIKLDGNTVFRQSIISILRQLKRQGITI